MGAAHKLVRAGLVAVPLLVVAAGAAYLYYLNFSPDRGRYPVRGIDISHHQGAIDWPAVAGDDVAFAYIKATEGGDFVDADFAANWQGARAAGLVTGAYHFFTFCRAGAEQAENVIATVPDDGASLPLVVDLEFGGNCAARPGPAALWAELAGFLERVESHFGRQAVFYVTSEFVDAYGSILPERGVWMRSIAWPPGHDNWLFWQYHNRGAVAGIEGDVDLNVFRGSIDDLGKLAAPATLTTALQPPPADRRLVCCK